MLLAEVAAAEGPEVTCEMGRARLMTTTISSPAIQQGELSRPDRKEIEKACERTDGSHPSSRLGFEHVDALGDQGARIVDHLQVGVPSVQRPAPATQDPLTFNVPLSPIILSLSRVVFRVSRCYFTTGHGRSADCMLWF